MTPDKSFLIITYEVKCENYLFFEVKNPDVGLGSNEEDRLGVVEEDLLDVALGLGEGLLGLSFAEGVDEDLHILFCLWTNSGKVVTSVVECDLGDECLLGDCDPKAVFPLL